MNISLGNLGGRYRVQHNQLGGPTVSLHLDSFLNMRSILKSVFDVLDCELSESILHNLTKVNTTKSRWRLKRMP